ncbi:MAG TPA: hypothetical protein VF937_16450, partial [Chloroflexota bacterium]
MRIRLSPRQPRATSRSSLFVVTASLLMTMVLACAPSTPGAATSAPTGAPAAKPTTAVAPAGSPAPAG